MRTFEELPTPTLADVAARSVHRFREFRHLSQRDLARWMTMLGFGWKGTTVSRVESGDRALRADELAAIALVLRVPLLDFWGRHDDPTGFIVAGGLQTTGDKLQHALSTGEGLPLPHAEVEQLVERLIDDQEALAWVDAELARWSEAQELLRKPVTEHRTRAKRASLWEQYRTDQHANENEETGK